jgi:hypothetical protein
VTHYSSFIVPNSLRISFNNISFTNQDRLGVLKGAMLYGFVTDYRVVPSLRSVTFPIWPRRFVAGIVTDISIFPRRTVTGVNDVSNLAAQIRRRYCH